MRTGDGPTEDAGGATHNEENVIRLPRDWLGPPEELVPIGPAARARAAQREADDTPHPADAFWSEDSAALHDAVQAPPGVAQRSVNPPVGLAPPVAGQSRLRAPRIRWRAGQMRARTGRFRARWRLLGVMVGFVVVVLAVIGMTEQADRHVSAGDTASSPDLTRARATAAAAAVVAKTRSPARRHQTHQITRVRARTHARGRTSPNRRTPAAVRHRRRTLATRRSVAPVRAPATGTSPTPVVSEAAPQVAGGTSGGGGSNTPVTTTLPAAAATASTASSRGSSSSSPPGPDGIGSISGGCDPKCP